MKIFYHFGAVLFFLLFVSPIFISPAYALGKKSDICGSWNNYCNGGQHINKYTPRLTGPTAKERREQWEKQDLKDASLDEYDTGLEYFDKKEWGNAIVHFKEALEYDPENYDALDDLNTAKKKLHDAYERQLKNKAFQEAKAAAEHGRNAINSSGYKESQMIFDTTGERASNSPTTVNATGYKEILGKEVHIPTEHKNNPTIIKMQEERKRLKEKFKNLEKELKAIKEKRTEGKENKGKLQVQEVKIKEKMDIVKQNTQFIDIKMESFIITLTKEKTPTKK